MAAACRTGRTTPSSGVTLFDKDQDVYRRRHGRRRDGHHVGDLLHGDGVNTPADRAGRDHRPGRPGQGEDLFCDVTTASTDADGDAITYSMAWTVDTASHSGAVTTTWTDDTVDGAETPSGTRCGSASPRPTTATTTEPQRATA